MLTLISLLAKPVLRDIFDGDGNRIREEWWQVMAPNYLSAVS